VSIAHISHLTAFFKLINRFICMLMFVLIIAGYSVTAQRQLFGGGGGGGRRGGGGGGGQKVSFRDSFGQSQNQNPYRWLSQDAQQQQQQQGRNAAANTQQMSAADIV
jgi:hypothetical protein